jgi:hypothetical protein
MEERGVSALPLERAGQDVLVARRTQVISLLTTKRDGKINNEYRTVHKRGKRQCLSTELSRQKYVRSLMKRSKPSVIVIPAVNIFFEELHSGNQRVMNDVYRGPGSLAVV